MRNVIIAIALICAGPMPFAKNIKLANTAANCQKVDGFGADDKMAIATQYKVPLSSVQFIGANWQPGEFGKMTCVFVFDTAKGPIKCTPVELLSSDNGKTAFGWLALWGSASCWDK